VSIPISTITAAIAGLTISGVTVLDTNALRDAMVDIDLPCLAPRPYSFVNLQPVERDTFGAAAVARKTVLFSLNYRYFHAPVGQGLGEYETFPGFLTNLFALADALIAADALGGTVDMNLASMPDLGVVQDGANTNFWGADVEIVCMVFINN
jgi:hypothetical protein